MLLVQLGPQLPEDQLLVVAGHARELERHLHLALHLDELKRAAGAPVTGFAAVVLEQHVYVQAGTRFEGPVYVGAGTQVLGGSIQSSALGPRCRVRGEIAESVFFGYTNKVHDGFIGHSAIGRWVNLGADTVTSDLKNTYGDVRLQLRGETIETHRQKLGSLIGDHAKTAIGTLLNTGAIVGTGANVFGATRPPKYVPPFAWGTDGETMSEEGFLTVASRVMPRRGVELTDDVRRMLEKIYQGATQS